MLFIFECPGSAHRRTQRRHRIVSFCSGLNFSNRPFRDLQLRGQDPRCSLVEPNAEVTGPQACTHLLGLNTLPAFQPPPHLSSGRKVSSPRPPGLSESPARKGRCADPGLDNVVRGLEEKRRACHAARARRVFEEARRAAASGQAEVLGTRGTPALPAHCGPSGIPERN